MAQVKTGLDVLVEKGFAPLKGRAVGLLVHQASVDARLRPILPLMREAGVDVQVLFGPEHGVRGEAQDMESVGAKGNDAETVEGARVHSLYGDSEASLHPTSEMFEGLDVVVVDLQDVGARYYTYAATMGFMMEAAAAAGVEVMILDRPNPLGGREEDVEGPGVHADYRSFVGAYDWSVRHGLTMGELARLLKAELGLNLQLEIVSMEGWQRTMDYGATGLPWVGPSPNMPTIEAAWVYPGQCLFEGTNVSEGRGTTKPFEQVGAPFLNGDKWVAHASPNVGSGLVLRAASFRPMFHKHAGRTCQGLQIHLTDRWLTRPLRMTVALIEAARRVARDHFAWRTAMYEFVTDRLAIDLLFGSDGPRKLLEEGASTDDVVRTFAADEARFRERRRPHLIY